MNKGLSYRGRKKVKSWMKDEHKVCPTRRFQNEGLTRCCRTLSVELNIAELWFISAEYGRLEMVKLIVKVFRRCLLAKGKQRDVYTRVCQILH